ncbi:NADP-specific glutamate dehydrogenase [Gammaproteobacteria bacterium LSUCC0057]|uniref:Glutamate dehydrogenase n=1 Tax=Gammaproteobacteria bacterium LSUCC0057 TaxID=2559237 RepID=A0A4Y8UG38_9GAMM|nr:NADP-specific glutamate dehydrogenase [Gammaproteobacteria bacterium LSUCC0057]
MATTAADFIEQLTARNPLQPEFHQAVAELLQSVWPLAQRPEYQQAALLPRLVEPERIVQFRVSWIDDSGQVQVNRGYRVQMNSALGPYKGGLRFHPTVDLSVLKFLAFEQVFKNALTGLPLGGAKGGADFNPRGRSDGEVMRFCQAFMSELYRHIGHDCDVPAGDIGVGGREIGYLFGMYKKLSNRANGVLTGKPLSLAGSLLRSEATGFGLLYFVQEMLAQQQRTIEGLTVAISGAGNVAQAALSKAMALGASVISISDSDGTVYNPGGFTQEQRLYLVELKNQRRGRISEMAEQFGLQYLPGRSPWALPSHIALPCATQNELDAQAARTLVANGCVCVAEGANMPTTAAAVEVLRCAQVLYAPGKASNAGGVAVSGLEMSQNAQHLFWTADKIDKQLHATMHTIHNACLEHGRDTNGHVDYLHGANIASFERVAAAMLAAGVV